MYLGMIYLQLSCSVINVFILSLWGKIPSQHFSTVVLIFTLLLLQTTIRPLLEPAGNALSIPWVLNTLCYLSLLCWVNSWYYLSICYFSFCVQYRGIYIYILPYWIYFSVLRFIVSSFSYSPVLVSFLPLLFCFCLFCFVAFLSFCGCYLFIIPLKTLKLSSYSHFQAALFLSCQWEWIHLLTVDLKLNARVVIWPRSTVYNWDWSGTPWPFKEAWKKNMAFLVVTISPWEHAPVKDLLHPSPKEKQQQKQQHLVQSPNPYLMHVECPGCLKSAPSLAMHKH